MAEIKTKKTNASVGKFLAGISNSKRQKDARALLKLMREATGMRPALWGSSIVGFGQYHYKSERSAQEGDWPLTGFSPRVQSLTVYIMPGFKNYAPLLKKLGKHTVSGGSCIYIKKLEDIHLPTLKKLVAVSVREMRKKYKA